MGRDWERLAGEKGRPVPSSRLRRMLKVGGLGVSVSASAVARKLAGGLLPRTIEERAEAAGRWRTRHAERVIRVLGELKGASMKVGQILSTDPELLPPEFIDALTTLQQSAPPMTYRVVRGVIEDALDREVNEVFSFFDPEPIGAASIGQVHRGTLTTGEQVAVKVQYPGVVESLDSDLKNLGSLLALGRAFAERERLDAYLDECRRAIDEESDYELEASHMRRFNQLLAERPGVRAPRPYEELTTRNVLTMELIEGVKLDEALADLADGPERQGLIERWVELYVWMFHDLRYLQSDPHPGNFLLDAAGNVVMLDFGCVKECDERFTNGILDVMDAVWQQDDARAVRIYAELGFGTSDGTRSMRTDPATLRAYHEVILQPFLYDEDFDFAAWRLRSDMQRFLAHNPSFLRLVPPAEAILPARVMSGIKGLLAKLGARMNTYRMSVETARRCGRLTGEPKRRVRGARA